MVRVCACQLEEEIPKTEFFRSREVIALRRLGFVRARTDTDELKKEETEFIFYALQF